MMSVSDAVEAYTCNIISCKVWKQYVEQQGILKSTVTCI